MSSAAKIVPWPVPLRHDIIAIGASAGGLTPLRALVAILPEDLAATLFVVVHVGPYRSVLPDILNRSGALPACHPAQGEPIRPGHIYVAPPIITCWSMRVSSACRAGRAKTGPAPPSIRCSARRRMLMAPG